MIAAATSDIVHSAITITGSLILNLVILATAWIKFKGELKNKTDEIKNHTDLSVQKLNGMLTYVIHSFDRPAWVKVARLRADGEIEFRMLEVNEHFASTFGIPRLEYIGRTDLEAGWDRATADLFRAHDLSVWASGEPATMEESIGGNPMRFRKVRVQSPDGQLKGIFGYAVDCQDPENCPLFSHRRPPISDKS